MLVLSRIARDLVRRNPRARSIQELFRGQRIIIIHSGGDSRRLAAYSPLGKIFTPLPAASSSASPATPFELIFEDLLKLDLPDDGRVVVASGDLMLDLGNRIPDVSAPGIVGVAFESSMQRARRHGVYVADRGGRVTDFMQKPTPEEARRRKAVRSDRSILVDSGLVVMDPSATRALLDGAGVRLDRNSGSIMVAGGLLDDVNRGRLSNVDLYEEILCSIAPRMKYRDYLSEIVRRKHPGNLIAEGRLQALFNCLHGTPFSVAALPRSDFLHIGTNRELLELTRKEIRKGRFGFRDRFNTSGFPDSRTKKAIIVDSIADQGQLRSDQPCFVEGSHFNDTVRLDGDNLVVGLQCMRSPLRLPRGWCLACVPIDEDKFTILLYGIDDDFKTSINSGGTLGLDSRGRPVPLADWLDRTGLSMEQAFPGCSAETASAWDARWWPVGSFSQVMSSILWMLDDRTKVPASFHRMQRIGMSEVLQRVDHDRWIGHRASIRSKALTDTAADRIRIHDDLPANALEQALPGNSCRKEAVKKLLDTSVSESNPLVAARLGMAASRLLKPGSRKEATILDSVMEKVGEAVSDHVRLPRPVRRIAIKPTETVIAEAPARFDLSGTWSDTPPICIEQGGSVLNAAILLDGQFPIRATASLSEQPLISVRSIDLKQVRAIRSTRQIHACDDPHDWTSLVKSALLLSGLVPGDPGVDLQSHLESIGGGIEIVIHSNVPKGSGLGTSSILGSTLLACLDRLAGRKMGQSDIIMRTSVLEQMMSTRGGWQDQVGGVARGLKIGRTMPGRIQDPKVEHIRTSVEFQRELASRAILLFTGQRRMARNLLQRIVGGYLARDENVYNTIPLLKQGAERMVLDFRSGDLDAVAAGIGELWSLKKRLDPGSTTRKIESIIDMVRDDLAGCVLPGAGGGGFLLMIARNQRAARTVRRRLSGASSPRGAYLVDFQLAQRGLQTRVTTKKRARLG